MGEMTWPLVDAHCHIDLYPRPLEVLKQAELGRVYTIAVTNTPSVFHFTRDSTRDCKYVRPALGLHPQLVHMKKHEVPLMRDLFKETRYIGEIGLDYSNKNTEDEKEQRAVFSSIIEMCSDYPGKILSVHSRNAASDVIDTIGADFRGEVILHWFSGTVKELERALSYGMFFSVNHSMLGSKKGENLVRRIPPERILTETDGPFTKVAGKPSIPMDVSRAVKKIAEIWQLHEEECKVRIFNTFRNILGKEFTNY